MRYLTFLFLFLISVGAFAQEYTVRTIFLKPVDVDKTPHERLTRIMGEIQDEYREQMAVHGHDKTFETEKLPNGNIKVHTIKGRHRSAHYTRNVMSSVSGEIPPNLNDHKYIKFVVIGGIESFGADVVPGGIPGFGYSVFGGIRCNDVYGGVVYISEDTEQSFKRIAAHMLGHAFGLYHNLDNPNGTLMGKLDGDSFELSRYEADWLSKHHFFNQERSFNCAPETELIPLQNIGRDIVRFSASVTDADGLHMAKLIRISDVAVINVDYLEGDEDTIVFNVRRDLLKNDINADSVGRIILEVMDGSGNFRESVYGFMLPELEVEEVKEPLSVENGRKITTWGALKTK